MSIELREANSPGRLVPFKLDITKDNEVMAIFKYIKDNFGGIDVCINNAGLSRNNSLLCKNNLYFLSKYVPI